MADKKTSTQETQQLINNSLSFINKCKKPSNAELFQIIRAVGMGFLVIGLLGYVVKLIHIPIRYLIV
ncbi:hypothetical protein FOG50_03046 [Hanseniaspora uvarum]|jgi:protein transport protein SEC61 subunit gamma and related proteins|nr:hypothetical protein FOG50_03046 [Hanseniaspora uvarum]